MPSAFRQHEPLLKEPPAQRSASPVRKPSFPKSLYSEDKFIDPKKEAVLVLPESTVASSQIMLEAAAMAMQKKPTRRSSAISSLVELLASWVAWVKKSFKGTKRQKARLTAQGQSALEQLRYLSALCDATDMRSNEEVLLAESAFGEAYYEILTLSSNLHKMAKKEEAHHMARYKKQMSLILRATE